MQKESPDQLRTAVRNRYGQIATESETGCGCAPSCSDDMSGMSEFMATAMGYSGEEIAAVPDGANLGLGCGNPAAIAALRAGETVVDLGAGAGFDCFLAARQVGESGRVIGIDMTAEMVAKARENADKVEVSNVEFRLGEIEHLPVADNVADVIISNCVINLSPEKRQVFSEAFRVLRPGGRLAASDIVATAPLPESLLGDIEAYTGCVAGAELIDEVDSMLREAGFIDVRITPKHERRELVAKWMPGSKLEDYVVSAMIEARKP